MSAVSFGVKASFFAMKFFAFPCCFLVFCVFAKKGIAIMQECGIIVKLRQISEV